MCIPREAIASKYVAFMKIKKKNYSRALTKYEFDNICIKELKCVFRIVRLVRDFFFFLQALVTIQEKYLRSLSDMVISNPDVRFKCRNQNSEV